MKFNKPTLRQRLHYRFDNMMSRGTFALVIWLGVLSFSIVFLSSFFLLFSGIVPEGSDNVIPFWEGVWISLMRTLAAGNLGRDNGWPFRITMFFVTMGGIFIVSTLIGLLNNGIRKKLETLKKARSFVIEKNHTLILGWSPKISSIIHELSLANEGRRRAVVVILADKKTEEMEDEVKLKSINTKNIKIIFRTGNPLEFDDIDMVNPQSSKSIIVLSPEDKTSDIHVIKTVLAITKSKNRRKEPYHIVAEIKNPKNLSVADVISNDEVIFVLTRDITSKLIVQTSKQPGLSVIYNELLSFAGSEIYFFNEPLIAGKRFKEVLFNFDSACLIGVYDSNGLMNLNPHMDTIIEKDDELLFIAEEISRIKLNPKNAYPIDESVIKPPIKNQLYQDKILILGWNNDAKEVIKEIDNYVIPGSEITIVASHSRIEVDFKEIRQKIKNQKINYIEGDITDRDFLESIDLHQYHHCVVLSYHDDYDFQNSDAITLVTLLHLRDMVNKSGAEINIVSQMLDVRNKKLAEVTDVDDFIVSEHLISLFLSQLSENKKLKALYDDIFNAEGSEIYLKPIEKYVNLNRPFNFYTLIESASRCNEIAIGYRRIEYYNQENKNYGIILNPEKSTMIELKAGDKLIVVAEEE